MITIKSGAPQPSPTIMIRVFVNLFRHDGSYIRRIALTGFLLCSGSACAASFDCSGKLSAQEKLICAEPTLSALDEKLAGLYAFARDVARTSTNLRRAQQNWLTKERAACANIECLKASYEKRVSALFTYVDENTLSFGPSLRVSVDYPVISSVGYCKSNHVKSGESGGGVSIDLSVKGNRISGTIEGLVDCGRKIIGPIEVNGELTGHVALVEFNGGHTEDDGSRALVASTHSGTYWRVISRKPVEGYVPSRQFFRK